MEKGPHNITLHSELLRGRKNDINFGTYIVTALFHN